MISLAQSFYFLFIFWHVRAYFRTVWKSLYRPETSTAYTHTHTHICSRGRIHFTLKKENTLYTNDTRFIVFGCARVLVANIYTRSDFERGNVSRVRDRKCIYVRIYDGKILKKYKIDTPVRYLNSGKRHENQPSLAWKHLETRRAFNVRGLPDFSWLNT